MLVTAERSFGTIGGGRLEWEASPSARELLASGRREARVEMPLGPGRRPVLRRPCRRSVCAVPARPSWPSSRLPRPRPSAALPAVLLFGAGHVGRALAAALAPLPLRLRWIDARADEFPADGSAGRRGRRHRAGRWPRSSARPAGSAAFVLTHSHALDFDARASAVLERGDFAYLGLIGSRDQARAVRARLPRARLPAERDRRLVCPIGGRRCATSVRR